MLCRPNTVFDEVFNGILLPLPFLAASLAFPSQHSPFAGPARPSADTKFEDTADVLEEIHRHQHFVQAGALSAAALLLIGTIARLRLSDTVLDRRKEASAGNAAKAPSAESYFSFSAISGLITRILSIALPFYASVQLDGVRVALVLLVTIATGLSNTGINARAGILARIQARKWAIGILGLLMLADIAGLLGNYAVLDLLLGYMGLLTSAFAVPPPVPYLDRLLGRHMPIIAVSEASTPVVPTPPATPRPSGSSRSETPVSRLADANVSIIAGLILAGITAASSYRFSIPLNLSPIHLGFSLLALATIAGLTFFALPVTIGSKGKPGLVAGLFLTGIFAFVQTNGIYGLTMTPFVFGAFCVASYFVALQSSAPDFGHFKESKRPRHGHSDHSMLTAYLLSYCAPGSMLDTILSERDSRRIAYFAL
jgi:zinc transporter 5/7